VKALGLGVAIFVLATVAGAAPGQIHTGARTIGDRNGDNRLERAAGELHLRRDDLGGTVPNNTGPTPILTFAHLADAQLVDEESPGRVELVDFIGGDPFGSAYRPQEGLTLHVLNEQIRAIRRMSRGPGALGAIQFAMSAGDNVDNAQLNETRWFIDLMDGGKMVSPDSGRRGTCGVRRPPLYGGMRGGGRFYEPNRGGDGPGYSHATGANRRSLSRSVASRDYPGLLERMNRPFRARGLGVPWYTVFGNHDGLVQGNFAQNELFDDVVVGCRKVTRYSPEALAQIRPMLEGGVTPSERAEIIRITFGDYLDTWGFPREHRGLFKTVPSDPSRRFIRKTDWIREHFRTRGRPRGHGFTQSNIATGEAHYAFTPARGIRFIVLDTVADNSSSGNIDEAQFRWLESELAAADARAELVLVFGHHSVASMSATGSGVRLGADLEALLLAHRRVLAYVAGHEHQNRIQPHPRAGGGGFWEIVTASHLDWPQQARVIELTQHGDDAFVIYSTIVDHLGPARPPAGPRRPGKTAAPAEVQRLASIGRELSFNDPQVENGEDGRPDRRGSRFDRNVALVIPRP
jgi:metallophosphoesterase (TIGR03767 family)